MKRFILLAILFLFFSAFARSWQSSNDGFLPPALAAASSAISTTTTLSAPTSIPPNDTTDLATVTVTANNGVAVQGSVKLQILDSNGNPWGGSPFSHKLGSGGSTQYGLSLPAGSYTLQAIFDAQGNYLASQSSSRKLTVGLTTTTTIQVAPTIDKSKGDVLANDALVRVSASDDTIPTGKVLLDIKGYPGSPFSHPLDSNGQTYFHLVTLPAGSNWQLQASYPGSGNYPASPPSTVATVQVVAGGGGIATTTAMNAPSIIDGSDAVVTVTVSSANGTPTGSMKLSVSGGAGIPANLNAQGVATYTLHPTGGPGDYTLDASYVPTGNFLASSAHGDLIVQPSGSPPPGPPFATSIAVSAPASITQGDVNARITVTVTASNGSAPTGQVGLTYSGFNNNQPFYHNLVNGQTQYTLSSLPAGSYQIQATYAAQGNFLASQSTVQTLQVTAGSGSPPPGPVATTITIKAPASITRGDMNAKATVTVTAADGSTPTGIVTMSFSGYQGGKEFPHTLSGGTTDFTLSSLPTGTYTMTAKFPNQNVYAASQTSTVLTVELVLAGRIIWVRGSTTDYSDQTVQAQGQRLQTAINNANPGDIIILTGGAEYGGPIQLPVKAGMDANHTITIQTDQLGSLPPGIRVSPKQGSGWYDGRTTQPGTKLLAQITSGYYLNPYPGSIFSGDAALYAEINATTAASYYSLQGIEFRYHKLLTYQTGKPSHALVWLGHNSSSAPFGPYSFIEGSIAQIPHHLVFDRCLAWSGFPGPLGQETQSGILCNGDYITIKNCYIYDFKSASNETPECHGIHMVNCQGFCTFDNNYIEASHSCFFTGGEVPVIYQQNASQGAAGHVQPNNCTFTRNWVRKPLYWSMIDPTYDGNSWHFKNLFELKTGSNWTLNGNTFENSLDAYNVDQYGSAIALTPRGTVYGARYQGDSYTEIHNITITNNHFINCYCGIEMAGCDNGTGEVGDGTGTLDTVLIRDNLFEQIGNYTRTGVIHQSKRYGYTSDLVHGSNVTIQLGIWPGGAFSANVGDFVIVDYRAPENYAQQYSGRMAQAAERCMIIATDPNAPSITVESLAQDHMKGGYITGLYGDVDGTYPRFVKPGWGENATDGQTNAINNVTIDHNTFLTDRVDALNDFGGGGYGGAFAFFATEDIGHPPSNGFPMDHWTITNNILPCRGYLLSGAGKGPTPLGLWQTIDNHQPFEPDYFTNFVLSNNVFMDNDSGFNPGWADRTAVGGALDDNIYSSHDDATKQFANWNRAIGVSHDNPTNFQLQTRSSWHGTAVNLPGDTYTGPAQFLNDIGTRIFNFYTDGNGGPGP